MNKRVFYFAAAAALFAACNSNDNLEVIPDVVRQPALEAGAVGFDVYANRAATRAGQVGDLTNAAIQMSWTPASDEYGGFGVFGYYTDNNDYDQTATPNFMYNQKVTYDNTDGYWKYEPVKYWPNEYGSSAISDDADKVTFFAYAPYVEVTPSNGKPTADNYGDAKAGITQVSRNTVTGDPIVKYIGSFDHNKAVDLCWGVNNGNTWTKVNDGKEQKFTKGLPWLDVQRPAQAGTQEAANATDRVKFTFRHALAKMQVKVNHFTDGYDNSNELDSKTRIFIRSVRFNGFAMQGALNLNNEVADQPYWLNYNGVGDLEADGDIVVYDGRRDGKEGMTDAEASNEKSLGLNDQFIQKDGMLESNAWTSTAQGVTEDLKELFNDGGIFYVIPVPGETVEVEIVYDVETIDENLATTLSDGATHGSSIENRISKKISFGSANSLEAGKAYEIDLHLGMNSVKFDAEVMNWDDMNPTPDIDLPANMPTFDVATSPADASLPGYIKAADADQDYYVFAVKGLVGGENVTATEATTNPILTNAQVSSTGNFTTPDNKANASGVVYVKAKADKYKGVKNTDAADDITITSASGKAVTLKIKQLAVKLGLTAPESGSKAAGGKEYTLLRKDGTENLGWTTDTEMSELKDITTNPTNNYIRVWKNGAELEFGGSGDNGFSFSESDGKLTLKKETVAGDVIKVTIKCDDVAEETISFDID